MVTVTLLTETPPPLSAPSTALRHPPSTIRLLPTPYQLLVVTNLPLAANHSPRTKGLPVSLLVPSFFLHAPASSGCLLCLLSHPLALGLPYPKLVLPYILVPPTTTVSTTPHYNRTYPLPALDPLSGLHLAVNSPAFTAG